jgi:putative transposase
VIRRQGYRFRLSPSVAEDVLLRQFLGCARFVWNALLAENQYRYEQGDPLRLSYASFCARLKMLKARHPFLRDVHSQPLQQTLRDLARAYRSAFDPKVSMEMPTFKKRASPHGIRFPQGFKVERNGVYLPKIGWIGFRLSKRTQSRKIAGTIKNVTIRLEGGQWYVTLQTERDVAEPVHQNAGSAVGIDLGVARFAALSDGSFVRGTQAFKTHERRLALLGRRLARKVKFSANWRKAKGATHETAHPNREHPQGPLAQSQRDDQQEPRDRRDGRPSHHEHDKSANGSVERPGSNVRAKAALNRRILDQGWGEFRRQLAYKLAWNGGTLLLVDARNTSRTCSACGHVSAENRRTQVSFICVSCGHASNADTNAAKNILGRAGCARIACGDPSVDGSTRQEARCVA